MEILGYKISPYKQLHPNIWGIGFYVLELSTVTSVATGLTYQGCRYITFRIGNKGWSIEKLITKEAI